jgi:hypothetical protein
MRRSAHPNRTEIDMAVNREVTTPSVLRVPYSALGRTGDGAAGSTGYSAWLTGPAGSGTARILSIDELDVPYDLIVVDYDTPKPHSRSWVRHSAVDRLVVYTLLGETPPSFPMRGHALLR